MTRSAWKAEPRGPTLRRTCRPLWQRQIDLVRCLDGGGRRAAQARTATSQRVMSTELRLGHCTFMGEPWSLVDCPGSVEFAYETAAALAAVDFAIVVCEPSAEPAVQPAGLAEGTRRLSACRISSSSTRSTRWPARSARRSRRCRPYSKYPLVLRQIADPRKRCGDGLCRCRERARLSLLRRRIPSASTLPNELREPEQEALAGLTEVLADHDDALLEKVIEDIAPSADEIFETLHKDQASGTIVRGALRRGGARAWHFAGSGKPCGMMCRPRRKRRTAAASPPPVEPLVQIFKTVHAGQAAYAGKLSYGRIWRGSCAMARPSMAAASAASIVSPTAISSACRRPSRASLSRSAGSKVRRPARCSGRRSGPCRFRSRRAPVYAFAIAAKDRKDDVKLSGALHKLVEEDPSLSVDHDTRNRRDSAARPGRDSSQWRARTPRHVYNCQINVAPPKVAYKETIKRAVTQHSRLKRQTGGHGQFADVMLEIAPARPRRGLLIHRQDRRRRGAAAIYSGGAAKRPRRRCRKGPLGYPVVDVEVTLVDGIFHSVDSSDMAFRTATRIGHRRRPRQGRAGAARADRTCDGERAEQFHRRGAAPAQRPARADPRLCRARGLARLGRCRGAGAGGRTA